MSAQDGGAAFPSPGVMLGSGHQQGAYEGMSLRDWFAGKALQGLIAEGAVIGAAAKTKEPHAFVASLVYQFADAMLKERAK